VVAVSVSVKRYRWLLLPLAALVFATFGGAAGDSDNLLTSRIVSSAQFDNSEIRVLMQAGAIEQFLDSPWLGSAIIERQFEDYPHNAFVESLMALGIVGGLMMLGMALILLRGAVAHFRHGALLVPLLAVQYFGAAQFSGSLAASDSLWLLLALVTVRRWQPARPVRPVRRMQMHPPSAQST
jgi:O-antigen ligase